MSQNAMKVNETAIFYCMSLGFFLRITRFDDNRYHIDRHYLKPSGWGATVEHAHFFPLDVPAKSRLDTVIKKAIDYSILPLKTVSKDAYKYIRIFRGNYDEIPGITKLPDYM